MLDEGTTKDENGTELPTLPLPSQRGGWGMVYLRVKRVR
jgi:hypothetical protein